MYPWYWPGVGPHVFRSAPGSLFGLRIGRRGKEYSCPEPTSLCVIDSVCDRPVLLIVAIELEGVVVVVFPEQ